MFVSHGGEDEYEQLNRQQLLDPKNAGEEEVIGFDHKSFSLEMIQGGTTENTDHSGKAYPCDKLPPQQQVGFEVQTATTTTTTTTTKQEVF